MLIAHVSDLHSKLIPLSKEVELVINTGDFFPDKTHAYRDVQPKYQLQWLKDNAEKIKTWLDGREMIFVSGNHDFLDLEEHLYTRKYYGLKIIDITNKSYFHSEFNIFGYPSIPYISGEWNYERRLPELDNELRILDEKIQDNLNWQREKFSILACHCPPYGILDAVCSKCNRTDEMTVERIGNRPLTNKINYGQLKTRFDLILCGHCHENHGWSNIINIPVSNAATTAHYFKICNGHLDINL